MFFLKFLLNSERRSTYREPNLSQTIVSGGRLKEIKNHGKF